jgi:hypothetical protein
MSKTQSRLGITIDNECLPISFYIPPFKTDVGAEAVLHVNGITNVHPLWNTWKWQISTNFLGTPPDIYSTTPTWADAQTGGLSFTVGTDDTIVRVILTNGDCIYWSNESGFEGIILTSTPYGKAYSASTTVIGGAAAAKVNFSTVVSSSGYLSASAVTDSFTGATLPLSWKIDYSGWLQFASGTQSLSLAVYLNGVAVPELTQTIKSSDAEYLPFAKSWILDIPLGQAVDLRAVSTTSDVTLVNTTFLLQQV